MFITPSDFVFPYVIPNITRMTNLPAFIDREEKALLERVLGQKLYGDFITGINQPTPAQKWVDIRDGKAYTYGGKQFVWGGLKPMLIPWVFSRYVRHNIAHFTGVGTATGNTENALVISSVFVEATFYNEASEKVDSLIQFITFSNEYEYDELTRIGVMTTFSL